MVELARATCDLKLTIAPCEKSPILPQLETILIGGSAVMGEVRRLLAQVARSQASVLITGPSGSGKEVVARCLHRISSRSDNSFVAVNCGAIPRELLESELRSEEHTSELQSLMRNSYAVFCLKKKKET